ncbi:uncharacterized protein LOC141535065 isoform X2 [Cotesia typhae]
MNVSLAYQLFAENIQVAMKLFKNENEGLRDCDPTISFMERVNNLIRAMSSRTPSHALRADPDCPRRRVISDFLDYLKVWEAKANEEKELNKKRKKKKKQTQIDDSQENEKFFFAITSSTLNGLKITLQSTLELSEFLQKECNFDYLMTSRLNQDQLEKFFGIMRNVCRCNDHPDTILFGQVFRLLCSYSLVTPPKGSNVTAGELLQSLMQTKESLTAANALKKNWLADIDSIIENGIANNKSSSLEDINADKDPSNWSVAKKPFDSVLDEDSDDDITSIGESYDSSFLRRPFDSILDEDSEDEDNNATNEHLYQDNDYPLYDSLDCNSTSVNEYEDNTYLSQGGEEAEDEEEEDPDFRDDPHYHHDYDVVSTSDEVVAYIAGYMARKVQRFSRCYDCIETLRSDNPSKRDKMIELMSNGELTFPSDDLFKLIKKLEKIVLTVVGTKTVKVNTMHQILNRISRIKYLPILGCDIHKKILMSNIINNFVVMRGNFLANLVNRTLNERNMMTKKRRKDSKLS